MFASIGKRPKIRFQSGRKQVQLALVGAIDIATQVLKRNPGTASFAVNYEPDIEDGFRRIDGYERLDGQAKPSDALWYVVELTDASDRAVGETLTGNGGASGIIVLIDGNNVAFTAWNGTSFIADETTNGAGDVVDEELLLGPLVNYEDTEIELAAQSYYRALIAALPGSGDVLGVHVHLGSIYGFRNNAGGTAAVLHRATSSGWEAVDLYHKQSFDAGTSAFVYGESVTSSGTGVGTVKKVVKLTGEWADNDAAGFFIIEVTAGSFLDNETLTGGTAGAATADGDATAITIAPDGRYEFLSHNFYAQPDTYYVYGCDGENPAFEIDSNHVYTPLITLTTPDTPKYIIAYKEILWLAIGASLIGSVPGVPYHYDGSLGAVELAVGAPVTGLRLQPGEVLSVATIRNIWGLYGTGATGDEFRLDIISLEAGAFDYSFVSLGYPFGLNDQGVVAQQRVAAYGNFEAATITRMVQPIVDQKKLLLTASSVLRKRNQIRFFFSDKTALVIAFNVTANGFSARSTTLELAHEVRCICNAPDDTGAERVLFGSTDGMVYEMEKGFSFDGAAIEHYLKLNHWNPFKNIRQKFHLFGVIPQIVCSSKFTLQANYELSFGSIDNAQPQERDITGGGSNFDQDDFDGAFYDVSENVQPAFPFKGDGTSVSVSFYGNDAITKSFTIQTLTMDISPRGVIRNY